MDHPVVWLFVFVATVFAVVSVRSYLKRADMIDERFKASDGFTADQKLMGSDAQSGIAIDTRKEILRLVTVRNGRCSERDVSFTDIVSSEVYEDDWCVTKTVRTSQVVGALVGAVLAGGAGFIVGGLSGKRRSADKVTCFELRLVVNDPNYPRHDVKLINSECKKGSREHAEALRIASHWHSVFDVIIKRADAKHRATVNNAHVAPAVAPTGSIVDEVKKLADLYAAGHLSAEEFDQYKRKLLSSG